MKNLSYLTVLVAVLGVIVLGCEKATNPVQAPLTEINRVSNLAIAAAARNFVAHCKGREEVPPRDTNAQGQAIFHLSKDETEIDYKLIVANIENVVAAHIHVGAAGVNGPIVAFLAGDFPAGGGRIDGVLAEGTITAANLVGPLAGHPLSDLISAMRAGNTYANVHTNDGVAPTNTGPGDFPGGEVRGQIR
ncbi:CHRD domain-containing protein [candidate division KSB1 bacterium]|nr:CHRD domain-containing protein [candidate division KSB1 bacterium]